MADDRELSANEQSRLRHVETDVLIPKIMREKAKDLCKDYVKGACCNAFIALEFTCILNFSYPVTETHLIVSQEVCMCACIVLIDCVY